jgi:hypothetical protein
MKCATLLLGLAMASITPAEAKFDRAACIRDAREAGFDIAQAKRACDPKNRVKPNEFGWVCYVSDGRPIFRKEKGAGARRKRDAVCE